MWNVLSSLTAASTCKSVCSVTVGGEEIPAMPPEMQLKVTPKILSYIQSEVCSMLCFRNNINNTNFCWVWGRGPGTCWHRKIASWRPVWAPSQDPLPKRLVMTTVLLFSWHSGPAFSSFHVWLDWKCSSPSRRTHWNQNKVYLWRKCWNKIKILLRK